MGVVSIISCDYIRTDPDHYTLHCEIDSTIIIGLFVLLVLILTLQVAYHASKVVKVFKTNKEDQVPLIIEEQ